MFKSIEYPFKKKQRKKPSSVLWNTVARLQYILYAFLIMSSLVPFPQFRSRTLYIARAELWEGNQTKLCPSDGLVLKDKKTCSLQYLPIPFDNAVHYIGKLPKTKMLNTNASYNSQFQRWSRSQGQLSWYQYKNVIKLVNGNIKSLALIVPKLLWNVKVFKKVCQAPRSRLQGKKCWYPWTCLVNWTFTWNSKAPTHCWKVINKAQVYKK